MRQRIVQKRAQFLVLAVVILVAALWSAMYISSSSQKTLDQRVQDVASQLECPICQNESVASSPSLLAQQMRMVIRQQLQSGKSEQEVIQYFARSYGDQIVGTPPWQGFSLLAWLVPIALLWGGTVLLWFTLRDWSTHASSLAPVTKGAAPAGENADPEPIDDAELEHYRVQLERELAEEDPLFVRPRMEGQG
jgi:cytochrome c-type biogenesis protein CcmH